MKKFLPGVIIIPILILSLLGCQTAQTTATTTTTTASTTTTLLTYSLRVDILPTITHYDDTHNEVTRTLNYVRLQNALAEYEDLEFGEDSVTFTNVSPGDHYITYHKYYNFATSSTEVGYYKVYWWKWINIPVTLSGDKYLELNDSNLTELVTIEL